jgi:predicted transcriptional regulator
MKQQTALGVSRLRRLLDTAQFAPNTDVASLSMPVGMLMRGSTQLGAEDSLDRAAGELRRSGNGLLPVIEDEVVIGVITERTIGLALAEGRDSSDAATTAMTLAPTIRPYATAAEALRQLSDQELATLVVVDDQNRLMGIISPSDLYPRRVVAPRPPMVGGMATPFGVYLTNGTLAAGAGGLALVATGFTLFLLLALSQYATLPIAYYLVGQNAPQWTLMIAQGVLPLALFMLLMRLIPLSGTHAAEHQVVHAIERGEELVPEIVRRMPRVHPRCGTNLAVGAMLFLGIFGASWIPGQELRFLLAAITTFMFWRRLGSLVQLFVTTKPASDKQIQSAIRAAQQLLDSYSRARSTTASVPVRIWRSGMLHVMAGSALCYSLVVPILRLIGRHFGIDIPI